MQNPLINLNEFLNRKIFKIPYYQRNYAWSETQLFDLWNDLLFLKENKQHFFGTIIIKDVQEDRKVSDLLSYRVFEIIDGQQRLTTISILVNEILNELKNTDIDKYDIEEYKKNYLKYNNIYLLELLNDDKQFYEDYIIDNKSYPEDIITPSRKRLKKAKEYYKERLSEIKDTCNEEENKCFLLSLLKKIKTLKMIQYAVVDNSDAILIFQTVNDRGVDLSRLDKTKSFLMHILYLTNPDDVDIYLGKINRIFADIFKYIEDINNTEFRGNLDEEAIQRYHYIIYKNYRRDVASLYFKHLKNEFIQKYQKDEKCKDDIMDYVEDLRKAYAAIKEIFSYNQKDEVKELLNKLFYLGDIANFYPLLIAFWIKNKKNIPSIVDVLKTLEFLTFRLYSIGKRRTDTSQSKLYTVAHKYYMNIINKDNLITKLNNIIKEYEWDLHFERNLEDPSFYNRVSGANIRYLFYEYEKHLRKEAGEPLEFMLEEFSDSSKYEIEHIWAQHPRFDDEAQEEMHDLCVHRLGNLTIANEGWNKKWGSADYEKKVKDYGTSLLRIQRSLIDYNKDCWKLLEIDERESHIIDFAKIRWKINGKKEKPMF